jgi:glyoxylase-like metal-dependent hydrolase (beta-lactamase superfamily II)
MGPPNGERMIEVRDNIRYAEIPNGDIMNEPTNMFIVGNDPVILIDTGSMVGIANVMEALAELGNPTVSAILLTHVHIDHGENTEEIRRLTDAPVRFHELELPELRGTTTHHITLDEPINNAEIIEHAGYQFEAVLTPGHAAGHLSFIEINENFGFVGDLVTGWGSSAVFPPWGNLSDYIESMNAVAERGTNPLLPSHGGPVTNGPEALKHFVQRRLDREQQILDLLDDDALSAEQVRDRLYENLPEDVLSDVTGNVILHLEKLERESRVTRIESRGTTSFVRSGSTGERIEME